MAKVVAKRDVGKEILEGLRQLKRGEMGRVVNVPSVTTIRERTGLSQAQFAVLLRKPLMKNGNGSSRGTSQSDN